MNRSAAVLSATLTIVAACSQHATTDSDAGATTATTPAATSAAAVGAGTPAAAASDAPPPPVAAAKADAGKSADVGTKAAGGRVPTCAKGQRLGTEAMSPFKPFCGAPCKTDADCTKGGCIDVNALEPDGATAKSGPQFVKICDPTVTPAPSAKAATSGKAAASAAPAAAPKCGPNQHFDDINKKCRPFGDCPKGYHWNDPMKSCLQDLG